MPTENVVHRQADKPFKIVVVVDPAGRQRGVFWPAEIAYYNAAKDLRSRYNLPPAQKEPVLVELANDVQRPHNEHVFLLHHLPSADLVIVNWDALNGDPSYGADVAARWWRHYRTNIWDWVYEGGILVIEGQANRDIPVQESYDALLGEQEVLLSGMEDSLHASKQEHRRVGRACRAMRSAKATELFPQGMPPEYRHVDRSYEELFPDTSDKDLPAGLRSPEPTLLWRGWFRRWRFRRTRFTWTPLLKAAEKGPRNYPTLLVATHGAGAIFVSTMQLALGQKNPYLLAAFLRARSDHDSLPKPGPRTKQWIELPAAAAVIVATVLYVYVWPEAPVWLKTLGGVGLLLLLTCFEWLRKWLRSLARTVMKV